MIQFFLKLFVFNIELEKNLTTLTKNLYSKPKLKLINLSF